jgi:hypothetical protein
MRSTKTKGMYNCRIQFPIHCFLHGPLDGWEERTINERNSWWSENSIYKGKNLLCLKYHKKQQKMTAPDTPAIARVHSNACGTLNNGTSKFMPKTPDTTPKMATTNVAVVRSSSNWISRFRTLSCNNGICDDHLRNILAGLQENIHFSWN